MNTELIIFSPVYLISALSILILLVDAFSKNNRSPVFIFAVLSLIITTAASAYSLFYVQNSQIAYDPANWFSRGTLGYSGFSYVFDIVFSIAGILTLFAAKPYFKKEFDDYKEAYTLLLFAVNGMMIIAHSAHLLTLFIGIEIMSITFYVMAGFIRNRNKPVEAALKYFLLGAFSTGFLVYGIAMLYGATGTMDINAISSQIATGNVNSTFLMIGIGLMIVGLSFKIAAFPFHQWAPDVYSGAPTVYTGFMSTAGKAAAVVAFIIVGRAILPQTILVDAVNDKIVEIKSNINNAQMIIAVISAATMLVGNLSALAQKNVKRMLAYSSVAHAGYMLMGIVGNNPNGYNGIIFYSAAYMFMQIGAFLIVALLEKDDKFLNISDYKGLYKNHPWLAALMAIFMFSLAGIPPFAGFPGKYMLFIGAVNAGFTWLTIVAVISTIISIYFYIGLVLNMYFKEQDAELVVETNSATNFSLLISTLGVFILGILPFFLINITRNFF